MDWFTYCEETYYVSPCVIGRMYAPYEHASVHIFKHGASKLRDNIELNCRCDFLWGGRIGQKVTGAAMRQQHDWPHLLLRSTPSWTHRWVQVHSLFRRLGWLVQKWQLCQVVILFPVLCTFIAPGERWGSETENCLFYGPYKHWHLRVNFWLSSKTLNSCLCALVI